MPDNEFISVVDTIKNILRACIWNIQKDHKDLGVDIL